MQLPYKWHGHGDPQTPSIHVQCSSLSSVLLLHEMLKNTHIAYMHVCWE